MVFGKRVLIRPSVTPDPSKFVLWATALNLTSNSTYLHGPFNFQPLDNTNRTHNKIHQKDWKVLHDTCTKFLLNPPTLGPNNRNTPNLRRNKRKRKS